MPITWIRRVTRPSMPLTSGYPKYAVPGVLTISTARLTFGHNVEGTDERGR